jgi:DNA-binding MarR family transcriptional regulator
MAGANGAIRRTKPDTAIRMQPDRAQPDMPPGFRPGPLADLIGFHLRKAQNASFQAFARRVGQTDLSPGTFALLTLIRHNPGISQTALSRADGRDKSSLTPALHTLERRGLILRQRLPGNRRTYALDLTPAGARILAELARHAEAHDRSLDRIVGVEQKALLIGLLRRIAVELADDPAEPGASASPGSARRTRRSVFRADTSTSTIGSGAGTGRQSRSGA